MSLPSRGEVFSRLLDHVRSAQSDAATVAHLHSLQDNEHDLLLAKGWLGISELFGRLAHQIVELEKGKLIH